MTLFKQWNKLINNQTRETIDDFWDKYSGTEQKIYQDILAHPTVKFEGKYADLVAKYDADPVIFMGFLDGIQTSLNNPFELDEITEESEISLDIDLRKLLFNMFKADADYLYKLKEWEDILTQEEYTAIYDDYRKSRTFVRTEAKIGRNDPCPCGSGKKYKNCCGKNA